VSRALAPGLTPCWPSALLPALGSGVISNPVRFRQRYDEIAAALTLTGRAADILLDVALALHRLPATMTALATGRIDRYRATVIADEITGLSDDHAAAVEQQVLAHAPGQTTGQLRAAARRAVLTADPAAVRERKERAQCDARVERWDEHAGTAALAGRDLPPPRCWPPITIFLPWPTRSGVPG
jgi:hypothetical protein